MTNPAARPYTVVIPLTARHPVPACALIQPNPNGSATAIAPRKHTDKRHLHTYLFHLFGNRACWPRAVGRNWQVHINPPVVQQEKEIA